MPVSLIIGWFILGFAVAAVVLYGPVMARAYWVRAQGIQMMRNANAKLHESTEMIKEATLTEKKYGELQDKHLALLDEYKALAGEMLAERNDYNQFLKKYEALLIEHKALLWRAGGGVEGTA